jgi:hypothetical protein
MRPWIVTGAARDGRRRQVGSRRAARDEATLDEHRATVVQRERRDDVEAHAAAMLGVVDQDLVPRIELARERHRAEAPAIPVGDVRGQGHRRLRRRHVDLRLQRLFFQHRRCCQLAAVRQTAIARNAATVGIHVGRRRR